MKRFFALLLLAVAPAFAQEYTPPPPPPTYDPTVEQTYTITQPQTPLENINQSGGTALTLYDDGTTYQPIQLPFEFYFFGSLFDSVYISQNGFISFTSNANGCCSGNQLPFLSEQSYFNLNNSIFAMWSDLADFNAPGNPYYKATENSFVVGWYGVDELSSGGYTCDEFGCTSGPGNKFTFEISLFADSSFSINYGTFDYNNQTGRTFTSGYQGDTATEYNQFYWGSNPLSLQNTTYFVQSSEIVPLPPDPPLAPDCTTNPYDPSCVIDSIDDGVIDYTDPEEILAAIEEQEAAQEELEELVDNGSDDGSDDGSEYVEEEEEEIYVADEEATEELLDQDLEEMLAEETGEEEILLVEDVAEDLAEPAVVATYRELTDEEKAQILADAISKDVLQNALAIASETTSSGSSTSGGPAAESSTTITTARSSNDQSSSVESTETVAAADMFTEQKEENSSVSDTGLDILETGRQIGQQALSETLAASDAASNDSSREAESIAAFSSETSVTTQSAAVVSAEIQSTDTSIQNITEQQTTETQVAVSTAEEVVQQETMVADSGAEAQTDMGQPVEFTTSETTSQIEQEAEMLAESFVRGPTVDAAETDEALAIVEASRATAEQSAFADESSKDAEVTTAMVDPALAMANTFNQAPNAMSLEFLGIIKPMEEKSDAEVRAEQVVAANKEQQEAINANYMDADQSGIVAAIATDADVSSYLSQRLQDVPFYKPEDIYKGIIIKDNVRGSYFLEKGNTDTYKKMVEEQYK